MPDTIGSMTRRAASAACLLLTIAARANAQTPLPAPSTPATSPDILTHYNFQLSMAALANDDQRFSWDVHFGGDVDLVDYVVGRANLLIDYEAVLGDEFRRFDPNQGNYTLEGSVSARLGATEVAGVFHHVSRHLGDRPKRFAIAWNAFGARALRRFAAAGGTVDVQGSASRIIQHSYVDYAWTGNLDVVLHRPVNSRLGVFAHGVGELFGVDSALYHRATQREGRLEGGVRFTGRAGAAELFVGVERRIDADPKDFQPHSWAIAGFRFLNR